MAKGTESTGQAVKVPDWVPGLRKAVEAIGARAKLADQEAKSGDRAAMRKAIACDNDILVLNRVLDRADKGFYN